MKIIVSHDVDHLYPSDHILKDLIFPKLWIRSLLQLLKGQISFFTFCSRVWSVFDKRLNRIPEIIAYDKEMGVHSTFFFGMANILGMSYSKKKAEKWIHYVQHKQMAVGVHGVEIFEIERMKQEFEAFKDITGLNSYGIRTHYVRYDDMTFDKMAQVGYLFDTSEFNKMNIELKAPYKIGKMWEFPLHIMDGYIMRNGIDKAKQNTLKALEEAEKQGLGYFTFLFHDYMFNARTYPDYKQFYMWFIEHCKANYDFVSYNAAIKELEQ